MKINQKGNSLIIGILIGLLISLLLGFSFYYFNSQKTVQSTSPVSTQIIPVFSPTPTPSLTPVSNVEEHVPVMAAGSEGESCGRNAGPAGNAKCNSGLVCKYSEAQPESAGVGTCAKP